jgi:hypothetical protein
MSCSMQPLLLVLNVRLDVFLYRKQNTNPHEEKQIINYAYRLVTIMHKYNYYNYRHYI